MGLNERLQQIIEETKPSGCAAIIRRHYQAIENALANGVCAEAVVTEINREYQTAISLSTFRGTLARHRARLKNQEPANTPPPLPAKPPTTRRAATSGFNWEEAKRGAPKCLE